MLTYNFSAFLGIYPFFKPATMATHMLRLCSRCFVEVAGPAGELPAPEHQAVEQPEVFALPVAKRPRPCLERLREAQAFQLESNSHGSSGVALNPAAFKQYPLREEQLRSLAWMYSREAREEGLKGGLLADKMGLWQDCHHHWVAVGKSWGKPKPGRIHLQPSDFDFVSSALGRAVGRWILQVSGRWRRPITSAHVIEIP